MKNKALLITGQRLALHTECHANASINASTDYLRQGPDELIGGEVTWRLCMWRESPLEHCCAADYMYAPTVGLTHGASNFKTPRPFEGSPS